MASPVSVIITVRNEGRSIDACVRSIVGQTRAPDEVVVVDGGSTDGTLERLRTLAAADARIHVYTVPGANISAGRNCAIDHAAGPIIAVTDAGTVLRPDWLAHLVRPLETDASLGVSAGFYEAGGHTFFERCLSTVITAQLWEVDPAQFLPSSRSVAFRKEWWSRVGGYPEWLRHCEDLVFDMALKRAGAPFAFAPDAIVSWNARPTLGRFFRQYVEYARGDAHAGLWPLRHAVRYGAYVAGCVLVALAARGVWWALPAAALGAAAYLSRFARRVWRRPPGGGPGPRIRALALLPVIVVTGDVAKMLGYALGWWDRLVRGRPSPSRSTATATQRT